MPAKAAKKAKGKKKAARDNNLPFPKKAKIVNKKGKGAKGDAADEKETAAKEEKD